jgi:hypothetical protein
MRKHSTHTRHFVRCKSTNSFHYVNADNNHCAQVDEGATAAVADAATVGAVVAVVVVVVVVVGGVISTHW